MRKHFLFSGLIIIGICFVVLFYLSYFGIKTNNFNKFIENNAKRYDERILLKLNDVYLKLSLQELSLRINTQNSKIGIDKNLINLKNIDINLNLIKFFKNQNSIEKVKIITDENKIKNITNLLNSYKLNIASSIIYSQISEGEIKAIININFDKKDENKFFYEINGDVKNANLNLIGLGNLNKINFEFNIKEKKYDLKNILFKYQNINFYSKKVSITKLKKDFEVEGDLNNKKGLININPLLKLSNLNLDILNENKVLIETENDFAFRIKSNLLIEDLKLKSKTKFDEIFTNEKYQNLIYFKSGEMYAQYTNKNLSINLTSGFSFIKDKNKKKNNKNENVIKLNILKKNKENLKIEGNLINGETSINPKVLSEILKINLELLSNEDILIKSNNRFNFQIDKNQKIQNLSINSVLNFDKVNFNKKFQKLLYLEKGTIIALVKDKYFDLKIDSKYSFINNKYKNEIDNQNIKIKIKNNKKKSLDVETNFQTNKLKINSKEFKKYFNFNKILIKDQDIKLDSENKINFSIDKKNNINDLKIKSLLKFDKLFINYESKRSKKFVLNYDDNIYFKDNNIEINYTKKKTEIKTEGKYSFNDKFQNYKIKVTNINNIYNFDGFFDLTNIPVKIDKIGYQKIDDSLSTLNLIGFFDESNKNLFLAEVNFIEGRNKFDVSNLSIDLNKYLKIKNIDKLQFNFLNKKKELNDIKFIKNNNNFELTGANYDGISLVSNIIKGNSNNNFFNIFENLNSKINIDLDRLYLGDKSYLENISGNVTVKNNKIYKSQIKALLNNKNKFSYDLKTTSDNIKITNLYIEEPEPFIKNYKFIKGFKEGALEFKSTKIGKISKSNLKIYDFKVQKVPVLAKILTLASLQGIADILTGEGIRFDELDMDYTKNEENISIKEMYAIGPAISIIMEGYLVKDKLTSLKGTLVPATTINKSIKQIPLIGNILVGKKVGEGVFGVSFKIKGPPKDLKTTVNPVKTLTPRFITRTLEKLKGN